MDEVSSHDIDTMLDWKVAENIIVLKDASLATFNEYFYILFQFRVHNLFWI